jgi:hypothetical protein
MYNPYDMLDFLLSYKVNDQFLMELKHKLDSREKFTQREISYLDSMFQREIARLRRITQSRFNASLF